MTSRLPFRYLEPTFFAGLFDDPLLLVHARPLGKSCLFDCGQIHHLAKRVLKKIEALFISHAHMDHFMGIDTFVRHNHVSPRTVDIYGPPGIAGKLAGYDWNLTEPYWCTLRVHEVFPSGPEPSSVREPKGSPAALRKRSPAPARPFTATLSWRWRRSCATTGSRRSSSG